jgi:hypothetical protein
MIARITSPLTAAAKNATSSAASGAHSGTGARSPFGFASGFGAGTMPSGTSGCVCRDISVAL